MLKDAAAASYLADRLVPANFVTRAAQETFKAASSLVQRGQPINQTALAARLQAAAPVALQFLMERVVPRIQDGDTWLGLTPDIMCGALALWAHDWRIRDAFTVSMEKIAEGEDATGVADQFLARLSAIEDLADPEKRYDDLAEHAAEMVRFLTDTENKGVEWGFRGLDRVIMPALPGDLVEIGGASGAGKSTVARNLVSRWVDAGHRVAWFSSEMSGPTQLMLLCALRTGASIERLLRKSATWEELERIDREAGRLITAGRLVLNERSRLTPAKLLATMERYRSDGCTLFVIDHINRIDYGEADGVDRRLAMGGFARDIKSFAQTHGVVVVALVQLVKISPHQEPDDSNIRESAQIIEEADKILFVWKPLVQHLEGRDGALGLVVPRRFDTPAGKEAVGIRMATDQSRIFITPGKQRILPPQTLISIGYDYASGAMFNPEP